MSTPLHCQHSNECADDCKADSRGIIVGMDNETEEWYGYFAHDTQGDGEWYGVRYQVLAGPCASEHEVFAEIDDVDARALYKTPTPRKNAQPDTRTARQKLIDRM